MTQEELNKTSFHKGMKISFDGKEYDLICVDFSNISHFGIMLKSKCFDEDYEVTFVDIADCEIIKKK
jgi:hypothetical protein